MNLEHELRELFHEREGDVTAPPYLPAVTRRRVLVTKFASALAAVAVVSALVGAAIYVPGFLGRDAADLPPADRPTPEELPTGTYVHDFGDDDIYPDGEWELTFEGTRYTYSDERLEIGSGRVRVIGGRLVFDRDTSCGRLVAEYITRSTTDTTTFTAPEGDRCTTRASVFDGITWSRR